MINFVKKQDSFFIEGITDKGNQIYFAQPVEKLLIHYSNEKSVIKPPTQIVIYSNFDFTSKMLASLEQSYILRIYKLRNKEQQIVAYPLIGFNYNKLKYTLSNLVEEFDL